MSSTKSTSQDVEIGILSVKMEMFEKKIDNIEQTQKDNHSVMMQEIKAIRNDMSVNFASKRVETAVKGFFGLVTVAVITALLRLVIN